MLWYNLRFHQIFIVDFIIFRVQDLWDAILFVLIEVNDRYVLQY